MRTALLSIAAAGAALGLAAPASAQWFPPPHAPAYGYHGVGAVRSMDARVEALRRHIYNMDRRAMLSPLQARNLDREAVSIKRRLWSASRNGLSLSERRSIDRRIMRLEHRLQMEVARNSRYRSPYRQGYGYGW